MPIATETHARTRSFRGLAALLAVVWLGLVIAGAWQMGRYDVIPGAQEAAPEIWPHTSSLPRPPTQPVLLCFIHPHCPCSVTTVNQIAHLQRHAGETLRIVVVVARAEQIPDAQDGRAVRAARSLSGIEVIDDPQGNEARCFGIATSGDCLLYAPSGRLLFHGGLTQSRSHEGPSRGGSAVLAMLGAPSGPTGAPLDTIPVYGCGIAEP